MVAACGLVYELGAGALASYLLGDSVLQFSTVIGTYLFAMGLGSWASRHVQVQLATMFVRVELLVGVFHGLHGHERIGEIRRRRCRKLGATPVDAIDIAAAGIGLAVLAHCRGRAFVDLALDLTGARLWVVEADLMVEAASALG